MQEYIQTLIEGLKKQSSLYEELYKMTIIEKDAFNEMDQDRLIEVLNSRLKLSNEITALESKLKIPCEKWITGHNGIPESANIEIIGLVKKIKDNMNMILEIENGILEGKKARDMDVLAVPKAKAVNSYKKM